MTGNAVDELRTVRSSVRRRPAHRPGARLVRWVDIRDADQDVFAYETYSSTRRRVQSGEILTAAAGRDLRAIEH